MSKLILIISIAVFFFQDIYAQEKLESNKSVKLYKAWVITQDAKQKGFLYSADENGITLSKRKKINTDNLQIISSEQIKLINIRRKGKVAKSSLIGVLSAGAVGFVGGMSGDSDGWFSKEEQGAMGAIALGIPGGIIGALVGTGRKKIEINYHTKIYLEQLPKLKEYSIKYQLEN